MITSTFLSLICREPLPQYNTESEQVSSRAVLKAGPSQAVRQVVDGAGVAPGPGGVAGVSQDTSPATSAKDVSFFTFQRGGPGGFSYKIQI